MLQDIKKLQSKTAHTYCISDIAQKKKKIANTLTIYMLTQTD